MIIADTAHRFCKKSTTMFHNLKGKFQLVQDGISASILGLKLKDDKQRNNLNVTTINFNAGAEILLQNEENWKEIHDNFEENARKAEAVDIKIDEIHTKMRKQLLNIQEITNFMNSVPKLMKKLEKITKNLASIESMAKEAEDILIMFQDLVEIEEYKRKEINEKYRYSAYIEKKSREVEFVKKALDEQYSEKYSLKERKLQDTLRQRQELFNMAFQQDMQLYKESGIVPNLRNNEVSSGLSLEDVEIDDDMESLNELLDS